MRRGAEAIFCAIPARIGLLGNPSDGYNGQCISALARNWRARCVLRPHENRWDGSITLKVKGQDDIQIEPFRDNRVLVSILRLNLIALLDMDREQIVWTLTGDFKLQHDAQLLANRHLLLFDNRGLGESSRILELDVATHKTAWEHPGTQRQSFYSKTRGLVQRFRNGNTLITETDSGRAFEVNPEGEIVWEFYNPQRAGSDGQFIAALLAMLRLPPDFPTDWITPPTES